MSATQQIAVVDYGMGNLHSVVKSVRTAAQRSNLPIDVTLTAEPDIIHAADKIIFPGQGAMPDCMASLTQSGLAQVLAEGFQSKPFFGICVGAQLLFERSEEGATESLGWFEGQVRRFRLPETQSGDARLKIPHMGWNQVWQVKAHPLFEGVADGERFYFVHSYYFAPKTTDIVLGQTDYPDRFASIVGRDNVFATQFHAEKSHEAGLRLLQNFIGWNGQA